MSERGRRAGTSSERKPTPAARSGGNGGGGSNGRGGNGGGSNGGGSNGGGGAGGSRGRGRRWNSEANKRRVADQILGRGEDSARRRLEERLRAAQGSPAFLRTYREYVRDHGMPRELSVLLLLLDLDDERETLKVLRALEESAPGAPPDQRNLLRGRLRNLEMSAASDALAHAAVDLLGRL